MKRNKAILLALLLVGAAILVTGCVAVAQERTPASQQAETTVVQQGEIRAIVSAQGNVTTDARASLVFASSGRIEQVRVAVGDQVTAGEVLAELESTTLRRQVERAQAGLATAQARLAQVSRAPSATERASAEAALAAATAGLEGAQARLNQLLAGPSALDKQAAQLGIDLAKNQLWGAQSQRDAVAGNAHAPNANKDSAEAQVLVAEVGVQQSELALQRVSEPPSSEDVAVLQSQVRQAQAQMAQAQAQVDQLAAIPRSEDVAVVNSQVDEAQLALRQAQDMMDDVLIKAPFAGTIVTVDVHVGEWANPGQPAIGLADTQQLLLEVRLDEVDVAQVAEGQAAILSFEALPGHTVDGVVDSVSPAAIQTQGGVAYLVDVRFAPGDLPVRLGMTSNVDLITEQVAEALLVPNRAIIADREANRYYVLQQDASGVSTTVEVQIGLRDDEHTQIVEGLALGDTLEMPAFDATAAGALSGSTGGLMGRINDAQSGGN